MEDPGETARVLVVDDDEASRVFVREVVDDADLPIDLDEAGTASKAVERARATAYDLLLLDYHLPDGDGVSVLETLAADGYDASVIILTGRGDEQTAVRAMKAGASDYLTKQDLTPTRLLRTIRNVLWARRMETQVDRLQDTVRSQERTALIGVLSETAFEGVQHGIHELERLLDRLATDLDRLDLDADDRETLRDVEDDLAGATAGLAGLSRVLTSLRQLILAGPDPEPTDLDETVRTVVDLTHRTTSGRVEIRADLGDPPDVRVDPRAFRQALLQLLNNATEAIPHRGTVTVRTEARDGGAAVHVQDGGPGVPAKLGERIFDLHATTKSGHQGVGLTLARHLVESMGGTLTFENLPDGGARFTAAFPGPEA